MNSPMVENVMTRGELIEELQAWGDPDEPVFLFRRDMMRGNLAFAPVNSIVSHRGGLVIIPDDNWVAEDHFAEHFDLKEPARE